MQADHRECAEFLRSRMADLGCEVTVSTAAPIVESPYEQGSFTCPHGIEYWLAPTSEQIMRWARDGVR